MRSFIALAAVAMTAATASPALARADDAPKHVSACEKAFVVRASVIARHGKRAPGRNICRFGVKHSNGQVATATYGQKKRYLNQLRLLIAPFTTAGAPAQKPAGVLTAHAAYALPYRIVMCESGGNPRAVNPNNPNRPAGLYQIITATWIGAGGGHYAPTADQATPAEQGVIAARIYNGGAGAGQWECR